MSCVQQMSAKAHPYALLYHLAAHAVVLEHFDLPLISMHVDPRRRTGAVHALVQHRDPCGSRMPVERDVVSAYAGMAAERYGCGVSSLPRALGDHTSGSNRLARFTQDAGEQAVWDT